MIEILFLLLKFFIPCLILIHYDNFDIFYLLQYLLLLNIAEALLLRIRFISQIGVKYPSIMNLKSHIEIMKNVFPFALSCAYSAIAWVLVSQLDKFIFSGTLSLAEFGYYNILALIVGAVNLLSSPISKAFYPKLTSLIGKGLFTEVLVVYRLFLKLSVSIATIATLTLVYYGHSIILIWTDDPEVTNWIMNYLNWYLMASFLITFSSVQFHLQAAFGDLRLHNIGTTIGIIVQTPMLIFCATFYGILGVGIFWTAFRLVWTIIWTPIIHNKFFTKEKLGWMLADIIPIIAVPNVLFFSVYKMNLTPLSENNVLNILEIIVLVATIFAIVFFGMMYSELKRVLSYV